MVNLVAVLTETQEVNLFTKERDDVWEDHWNIIDPLGDVIFTVTSESGAEIALSYLNK